MAFVTERIPEQYWEMYDSWGIIDFNGEKCKSKVTKKQSNGETYDRVFSWTADYERNIYFFLLGGNGAEIPQYYALIWNNQYINIAILSRSYVDRSVHYNIDSIIAPKSLESKSEEIMSLVEEVIKAKIYGNPKNEGTTVVIDNIAKPKFVEKVKGVRG